MLHINMTNHALAWMAQRGIHLADIDLIMEIGSEVDDGFLVREKDCQEVERVVKEFLHKVRRLKGKRIVVSDGALVTAFHAGHEEQRRLLRSRGAR